jgi:hypothetical protein
MIPCRQKNDSFFEPREANPLELVLLSATGSYLLYCLYYLLAPLIWAQNMSVSPMELTPWMRGWFKERDGIEVYALYVLVLANVAVSVLLARQFERVAGTIPIRRSLLVVLLGVAALYVHTLGFSPPMSTNPDAAPTGAWLRNTLLLTGVLPLLALLNYLQNRANRLLLLLVALLLLPVCFIATDPGNWGDAGFIFLPALRILNGAALSDIYLQYDLLFSLLAALWMKLRLDLDSFQHLCQGSVYLLILATFILARKLFLHRSLALFLLVALVLYKVYAMSVDPASVFQVTPLRLDMWLPLLMLAYFRGAEHWSTGLWVGMLLVLHRNFGLIYFAAYCQLLLTLMLLDYADNLSGSSPGMSGIFKHLTGWLTRWRTSLVICGAALIAGRFLYGNSLSGYTQLYQKVGLGFIKISATSFYWYVPVLIGAFVTLLLKERRTITSGYLASGLFLVYLVIGNSIYFFGRSHENNIINISSSLILLFFLFLDLAWHSYDSTAQCHFREAIVALLSRVVPAAFIVLIVFYYGDNITRKLTVQKQNAGAMRTLCRPDALTGAMYATVGKNLQLIKLTAGTAQKFYFVSYLDFMYYYCGQFAPVGYVNPCLAWVFSRDFGAFLTTLLNSGYLLVVDDFSLPLIKESLPRIPFNRKRDIDGLLLLWKE